MIRPRKSQAAWSLPEHRRSRYGRGAGATVCVPTHFPGTDAVVRVSNLSA